MIFILRSWKQHTGAQSWYMSCFPTNWTQTPDRIKKKNKKRCAPVANFFLTAVSRSWCEFSSKWWVLCWQPFSVCDILRSWASWRQRGRRGSACLLWFTVPVSRQAWSSGSCTPALSHTSAWQAKLLKGRTGARRPRLARLTHETKTQCYQSASASLWCQSVLLIRESLEGYLLCLYHLSRLPPHVLYMGGGWCR